MVLVSGHPTSLSKAGKAPVAESPQLCRYEARAVEFPLVRLATLLFFDGADKGAWGMVRRYSDQGTEE